MIRSVTLCAAALTISFWAGTPAQAQRLSAEAVVPAAHQPTAEHHEVAEKHEGSADDGRSHAGRHHPNEVAVFLGATDEPGHDPEFTWGLDYKRRIAERWAVGALFDHVGGELRNSLIAPSITWWPDLGDFELLAAAGVEFHDGRGGAGEHGERDEDETHFVIRIGSGYNLRIGERYGVIPNVNLDFVDGERVWVYGLNFTYGF